MPEVRRKYDPEFREGKVRIVCETGKPIAKVAEHLFARLAELGDPNDLPVAIERGEGLVVGLIAAAHPAWMAEPAGSRRRDRVHQAPLRRFHTRSTCTRFMVDTVAPVAGTARRLLAT